MPTSPPVSCCCGGAGPGPRRNGLVMSLPLAEALLDSRHFSSDGRLGYWTPAQVRRALLEWIPEKVTAPDEDLLDAPETLRTLLRYLDAHGLRDPRGAAVRGERGRHRRRGERVR